MRIIADRKRCVGAGQCVLAAPGLFDQSEADGQVIVLGSGLVDPADEAAADEAVELCPSRSLTLGEDEPAAAGPNQPAAGRLTGATP